MWEQKTTIVVAALLLWAVPQGLTKVYVHGEPVKVVVHLNHPTAVASKEVYTISHNIRASHTARAWQLSFHLCFAPTAEEFNAIYDDNEFGHTQRNENF